MESKQEKGMFSNEENGTSRIDSSCWGVALDKDRLRDILDNIPSAVIILEKPDGMVTYANKRAIELYGVNPCGITFDTHVAGFRIRTLNDKHCPTEKLYTYRALFNEEAVFNESEVIERKDGKRFVLNVSVKPLYNNQGKVDAAVAVFVDVTERVKTQEALRESEERLRMAQELAHMGSWEYYVKEDKAIWSEELFRIFGLPPAEYGPNVEQYIARVHPADRDKIRQGLFSQGADAKASFDYRIVKDDGSVRTIHSERRVREVDQDNKPIRIVGIEQDITERKQIEQKLEEYAKNLEKIVDERTRQLKDAERLATIGQTAGMIGHDIRNPLQAIAGELFLMKQAVDTSPDSQCKREVHESLVFLEQQIDYINKIVSDLQDYTRTLKPDYVEVDLSRFLPQMVSSYNFPRNVTASFACEENLPPLKVDLTFLKRIMVNLFTNAVQAMPNGGELSVKVFKENSSVAITISDTGVGIPEDFKPKIFQPLMTTKSKGQGFGLAVVKRLVEAQGGAISFESKVGVGTTFKILFQDGSRQF